MTTYRYIGDGAYLEGVPARDLDVTDVDALDDAQLEAVKKSGLYEELPKAKHAKKDGD